MTDYDWSQAKVGDKCFIMRRGWHISYAEASIDRLTDTQIVVGAYRFRKKDGWEVGGTRGYREKVLPYTPEVVAEYKQWLAAQGLRQMRNKLRDVNWEKVEDEVVSKVWEMVKEKYP